MNSVVTVVNIFQEQLSKCISHFYRIRHQFTIIRKAKETLQKGEALIHIDYSENYCEKIGVEIQAAHFGTRNQIVIHQGMLYLKVMNPYCSLNSFRM
jgi:hypothetical protein